VLLPRRIDLPIAQGFGFVVPARERGNTPRILSSRAGATEPKNKRTAGQYASGAALVVVSAWAFAYGCGVGSLAQREVTHASPESTHSAPNRCYPTGALGAASAEPPTAAAAPGTSCRPFARAKLTNAEASLRRSYQPIYGDSRVIVDFPCDPVEQVSQIDLELAEQRSLRLELLRFTRPPEGGDFRVLGVEIRAAEPGEPASGDQRFDVKTVQLELAASALDLEDVRTPLMATINEVQFSDHLPSVKGFTGPSIRRLVRVQGRDRHLVRGREGLEQAVEFSPVHFERSYTGEAESIAQKYYLPLDLAAAPLLAAVPAGAFGTTVTDECRALIGERFEASFDAAPDWLRELFLGLASRIGSSRMIPALVRVAQSGPEPQRVLAVNALAAITGWDARTDAKGTPRPLAAVAANYAQECAVRGAPAAAK
jgi:hypothetical protein